MPPDEAVGLRSADLVVIATPNDTHVPLATAAFNAGKHVVVEKPFALTLEEGRLLARQATATNRLLTVFQNRRWDSDFLGANDHLVTRRVVGEVAHFESHFDRYRPDVRVRWREQSGRGSGVWYDLGPHLVDQALQLFGLPDRVTASLAAQRPGAQTDDWAHVILEYARLRVILNTSMLASGSIPRFIVHGQTGSWFKYGLDVQEGQLIAGMRPGDDGWGEDLVPAVLVDGGSGKHTEMAVPRGDYRQFYVLLRDAVDGIGKNPVPPAQAVAVVAVIETAIRSWKEGRALPLPLEEAERRAFSVSND